MGLSGWGFPRKKTICDSCLSLEYDDFKNVRTNRKRKIRSDKEAEALLPLMIIDDAKKKTQWYTSIKSIKNALKRYDERYRKSNIRIVDRQHYNLNDYFLQQAL